MFKVWSIVLLLCLSPVFAREAWPQTQAEFTQLQTRLDGLSEQVSALERSHLVIACGRIDSDLMKDGFYRYPMSCHSGVDPNPPPSFDRPILNATLIRPGVFRFD